MKISVVIPTYNEEKNIKECLSSLKKQTQVPNEILVVDDGSQDNTVKIVKNLDVKVFKSEHVGRGKIRNIGWKNAIGDIIIFGDADTVFDKYWIENIISKFDKFDAVADKRAVFKPKSYYLRCLQANYDINYHDYQPFCAWAMKRKVLEETGGFDENLHVSEERDLGKRIKKAGFKIGFAENAIQYHRGEPRTFISGLKRSFGHAKWRVNYYKKYPEDTPFIKIITIILFILFLILAMLGSWIYLLIYISIYYIYLFINQAILKKGWDIVNKKYLPGIAGIRFFENIFEVAGIGYGFLMNKGKP